MSAVIGSRVASKLVLLVWARYASVNPCFVFRMYWECLKNFVSTPWFSRYFLTAERYEDAVRGTSARPVVNDVRRTVIYASGHVIVECWNRSDRFFHSRGMCFMHGSVPRAFATVNQRRSAVEYVFLVEGCTVHVYNTWPRFNCRVR
jgi:hypothetical protein